MQGQFKPDVTGWGQRGTLSVAKILETMKDKVADAEAEPGSGAGAGPEPNVESDSDKVAEGSARRSKRLKRNDGPDTKPADGSEETNEGGEKNAQNAESKDAPSAAAAPKPGMTVEEYEAMLDAETADWDFPDGM